MLFQYYKAFHLWLKPTHALRHDKRTFYFASDTVCYLPILRVKQAYCIFFRRSYIKNLAFDVRYTEILRNFILANHSDSTYDMQDIGTLN